MTQLDSSLEFSLEFRTATEIAAAIRAGQVSSREVTERMLDRIAADSTVNAVVATRPTVALAAARAADEAVARAGADRLAGRGRRPGLGPLHGVPVTVKEAFQVTGLPTTWGNPAFAGSVTDRDATVVRRLERAGAIVVGKSNVHTMLADFGQTANEIYGRTNNPHDPARTPGGSGGGGAAALAAGLTFLEYGSDLAGSIRLPAGYCGVYGLRPTAGVVPLDGFQPPGPPVLETEFPRLSAIGPLARSAADLRVALAATGGPTGAADAWRLRPPRRSRPADFRVGVVLDHPAAPVTGEVGAVLSDAVDDLARRGVTVVEGWPPDVDPREHTGAFGFQVELFFALTGADPDFAPLATVIDQERRRMAMRAAWHRYLRDVDVFLTPTSFTAAFPHDQRPIEERTVTTPTGERPYTDLTFWIAPAALLGLPALSMPAGTTADGLPVGLQVLGAAHDDNTVITFSELMSSPPA